MNYEVIIIKGYQINDYFVQVIFQMQKRERNRLFCFFSY